MSKALSRMEITETQIENNDDVVMLEDKGLTVVKYLRTLMMQHDTAGNAEDVACTELY